MMWFSRPASCRSALQALAGRQRADGRLRIMNCLAVVVIVAVMGSAQAQTVTPQISHSRNVDDLVFSRDGKFLLTSGTDSLVKLWDVASGKVVQSYSQVSGKSAISGDNKLVATTCGNN